MTFLACAAWALLGFLLGRGLARRTRKPDPPRYYGPFNFRPHDLPPGLYNLPRPSPFAGVAIPDFLPDGEL